MNIIYKNKLHLKKTLKTCKAIIYLYFFISLCNVTYANIPLPNLKALPKNTSFIIDDSQSTYLRKGLRASNKGHWSDLNNSIKNLDNDTSRDLLYWARAIKSPNISFKEINYVVEKLHNWPRAIAIQAKAESILFDDPISHKEVLTWFESKVPVSGEGRAVLARAYYKIGDTTNGDYWLRKAWNESKLTGYRQRELYLEFKDKLTENDHYLRADHLLWQGKLHYKKINQLLNYIDEDKRSLIRARMKIATNRSGIDKAINAIPEDLVNDASLNYERSKWRRIKKSKNYALPVIKEIDMPVENPRGRQLMWLEKRIYVRWLIEEKRYQEAYNLSINHGISSGARFAEAEFTAGWLALTKLKNPLAAKKHFKTLNDGVSTSVSSSRALYWLGRTSEELKDEDACKFFMESSNFTNTFYGQLSLSKINRAGVKLILPPEKDTKNLEKSFSEDSRIKAMNLLGELGEEELYTSFSFHMDDQYNDERLLTLLSQLSVKYDYMRPSIRAAKQASRFKKMLTVSGYPLINEIEMLPKKFDIPFVYAIARQESEFEYNVVSTAKAYGMMQMIDSTARETAKKHNINYSKSKLIADRDYSAKLGALHLNDLLERFDGSYILAASAYNAGAHRASQWIQKYGDPRLNEVDTIDWIESIPFSETRNYVQRVMENLQIYRARRNNNQFINEIKKDINTNNNILAN
jgi:soluble lytic murein transglycosylase